MSIELNKESVEQADASSCQGTNCGTTTGDHSSECLAEAAAGQGWELKPGDLCGRDCPIHKILAEQAGGDERKLSDLGNELHNLSCSIVHENEKLAEQIGGIARELWNWPQSRAALEQPSPDAPYADDIAADLERSDWTPEDALRWYAAGKHFDTTNGRTRIIDTGAVASNALKHLSLPYLEMKGDAELTELREAMAQPSPKCNCPGFGKESLSSHAPNCPVRASTAQPSPAQAEAERPEVVARVVHSNPVVLGQCGPLNANDELMTVAQHAASVARWAEMFNRVEQERDAALARVAELEKQEPVATVAKVPSEDWNSLDFHRDLQHMQPGTKLYAAPVAQAQQLHDLDKQCRDDVARALGLRPNQERGFAWSYLLASIKSCVKASGDSAQAQHSVPVVTPEMVMAAMAVFRLDVSPFKSMEAALIAALRKAAAPGKEVGHE